MAIFMAGQHLSAPVAIAEYVRDYFFHGTVKFEFQKLVKPLALSLGLGPPKCFFSLLIPQQHPSLGIACAHASALNNGVADALRKWRNGVLRSVGAREERSTNRPGVYRIGHS
jgi:hypothetical protein